MIVFICIYNFKNSITWFQSTIIINIISIIMMICILYILLVFGRLLKLDVFVHV